jgi:hypothetical protein
LHFITVGDSPARLHPVAPVALRVSRQLPLEISMTAVTTKVVSSVPAVSHAKPTVSNLEVTQNHKETKKPLEDGALSWRKQTLA